jgi:hypothetical protein
MLLSTFIAGCIFIVSSNLAAVAAQHSFDLQGIWTSSPSLAKFIGVFYALLLAWEGYGAATMLSTLQLASE